MCDEVELLLQNEESLESSEQEDLSWMIEEDEDEFFSHEDAD